MIKWQRLRWKVLLCSNKLLHRSFPRHRKGWLRTYRFVYANQNLGEGRIPRPQNVSNLLAYIGRLIKYCAHGTMGYFISRSAN